MNHARRWAFFPSILVFILLVAGPNAYPQALPLTKYESSREPVRIRADSITYDDSTRTYVAEGKVEILQGDRKLTADRAVLNSETQEAEATGKVVLVQGEDYLRGERMIVALDTNLGIIVHGTLFLKQQNYYLRGEEIERLGEDTYRIRGATFTTCNGEWPAWRFTGSDTIVTLNEYADVYGATFQVKNIPILYFPYLVLPVKTTRQSGFLAPRVGYSNTSGGILGLSYFWAMERNMDATFTLDEYTTKGLGEGVEYRYIRKADSDGSLYGYHIREGEAYRKKYTDPLDRKSDRWGGYFEHEEYFSPSFFARTRLIGASDREYFQEYGSSYSQQASEQIYSFLSLTRDWERFSLFGEARRTVDLRREDKTTLQYYPVTNFVAIQQPLLTTPFFFNLESSYGYFFREQGASGHRVDLFPALSLPLRWGGLEFNAALSGRETRYDGVNQGDPSRSREIWSFQSSLATDIYRVFDTGLEGVPRLKHVIRPEITYLYIPNVNQSNIPYYDIPIPQTNALFYGFTSRLIGKVVEGKGTRYHEFVYLKIGQTYNLQATQPPDFPEEPPRRFGLISEEVRIKGTKYISLENVTNYDPNSNSFLTSYTNLGLSDSRGDSTNLEYIRRKGVEEQINGSIRIRVLPPLDLTYGKRYALKDRQTLETDYGFTYRHQCWGLEVSYSEKPSVSGSPAERKIWFMINLLGVMSVGTR